MTISKFLIDGIEKNFMRGIFSLDQAKNSATRYAERGLISAKEKEQLFDFVENYKPTDEEEGAE